MRQNFFFLFQITSRCICLRLITAHPSFCIFSTRLITLQLLYANYKVCFSASSLTSLEEKNNNNTLVFITEPDAHKFDNGKINQRKVTCTVCTKLYIVLMQKRVLVLLCFGFQNIFLDH